MDTVFAALSYLLGCRKIVAQMMKDCKDNNVSFYYSLRNLR